MANKKKPTNKEMVQEINYLGQKLMMMEQVLQNYVKAFDLYVAMNKHEKKFKKFIDSTIAKAKKEQENGDEKRQS